MNSKQLHYFIKTAETGSISAAAKELGLAQPAISQQLANLEHELSALLFERDFRGVRLTDSGERFYLHAKAIIQQMDLAKLEITDSKTHPAGPVSIGMAQAVCNVLAIPLLQEIEQRWPDLNMQLHCGSPQQLNALLRSGEIDLAVNYENTATDKEFIYQPLIRENIYLIVGTDTTKPEYQRLLGKTEIDFAELAKYEIVLPDKNDPLSMMLSRYENHTGITLNRKQNFGLLMTSLRFITAGNGIIILPSSAIFHLEKTQHVVAIKIVSPVMTREVSIVNTSARTSTRAMQAVSQAVKEITLSTHASNQWRGELLLNPTLVTSRRNAFTN